MATGFCKEASPSHWGRGLPALAVWSVSQRNVRHAVRLLLLYGTVFLLVDDPNMLHIEAILNGDKHPKTELVLSLCYPGNHSVALLTNLPGDFS